MRQIKNFIFLIVAIIVVILMAVRIYSAQSVRLIRSESDYNEGKAIVLNKDTAPASFAEILTTYGYIQSEEEASFIAHELIGRIPQDKWKWPESLKALGNAKEYGIELDSVGFSKIAHYPYLKTRAEKLAGGKDIQPCAMPDIDRELSRRYTVKIRNEKQGLHRDTVYLHIREHYNELDVEKSKNIVDCKSMDSTYAYIPVCGKAKIWLPVKDEQGNGRYFSILPVERGYVFGGEKGTYRNRSHTFKFVRKRAVLPLLGDELLKYARRDNCILMRTSHEYRDKFISALILFSALWVFVFMLLSFFDKKREGHSNLEILAIVALLSGVGLVNLFNLQNPLWGELLAWAQLEKGFILGLILLVLFSLVDWVGIYRYSQRRYLQTGHPERHGLWLALGAIGIAFVLMIFGNGPSGVHTNLPGLNIQGSPLIKLLSLGYFAVFFSNRGGMLEAYSKPGKMRRKLAILLTVITVCCVLGAIQLKISDLGPFLVIAITVIFIFSLYSDETIQMLIVAGIFGIALWLCNHFTQYSILPLALFIAISAIWVIISRYVHKRILISPVILCLVLLMAFQGGDLFKIIGQEDLPVAERLNGRSEMASNVFNNETLGGDQIATAIWAVSRGGMFGNPRLGLSSGIPAGHTDLVFESLIENLGIIGGLFVLVCIGMLLFIALRIGIQGGHPFCFSFASLISLSICIQTCLIVLGSLGIIPLTGITCPFISYGGSALAIDMACVGILISLSRHKDIELERMNTQKFEKVAQGVFCAYIGLAIVTMSFVLNFGLISRLEYMIKPGKFINREGERIVMINPLIDEIKKQLLAGDILDRNGKILASTDAGGRRIYPYGKYTFFMVGDQNSKVQWGTTGRQPSGLRAEERYEMYLKGFDTRPIKIPMNSSVHYSRFLPNVPVLKEDIVTIEDYTPLLPFMTSERRLKEWNEKQAERNLVLTLDAELQKELSLRMEKFIQNQKRYGMATDITRGTILIDDASDGSLLTSALYPLPDQDTLRKLALTKTYIYRDTAPGFKAYTDRDLGLVVSLAPGSAVKPLSAGAGLIRFGPELASEKYNQIIYHDEIIDVELGEPEGNVNLKTALTRSSNIYFIKLLSQYGGAGLYPELAQLYYAVGAGFGHDVPYVLYPDEVITREDIYRNKMEEFGKKASTKYSDYMASGKRHKLNDAEYQPAWGQGLATLTPLALARYTSAAINNGTLMSPRYTMKDSVKVYKQLLSPEESRVLQDCMKAQAAAGQFGDISAHMGGKTGTSNRNFGRGKVMNDALYVFYLDSESTSSGHALAITIRLERVNTYSKIAMQMAREVVLPTLKEKGYLK